MKSRGGAGGCYFSQLVFFAVKGRCRHFRVAHARMTAGIAVAFACVCLWMFESGYKLKT